MLSYKTSLFISLNSSINIEIFVLFFSSSNIVGGTWKNIVRGVPALHEGGFLNNFKDWFL